MEFLKMNTLSQAMNEVPKIKNKIYYLAGGTDLMVMFKDELLSDDAVIIDIHNIKELNYIKTHLDSIAIGSLTTFSQILNSFAVRLYSPVLIEAAKTIGSVQIRNRATIGGNIANASPAADSLPALFVHDAEIVTLSKKYKIAEFFTGVKNTILSNGELIKEIIIPKIKGKYKSFFFKSGPRQALAISKSSLAVLLKLKSKKIAFVRIAAGAVAKTVIRAYNTENFLLNNNITDSVIQKAKSILADEIAPITDFRSTEQYRKNIITYFLEKALQLK